jgi:SAM-dependent methyltransferase
MRSPWDTFFRDKVQKIFAEKKSAIDIGGGLRALQGRGNRYDPARAWIAPLLARVDYKILDPVPDYQPDVVGDIHALPFADNSQDAYFCLAILEHVEDPKRACREMYRTLSSGGYCLLYVPFLYYYHAEQGYYHDYWRFTEDSLRLLFKDFTHFEIQRVRGAIETWLRISPLGKYGFVISCARWLDRVTGKAASKQVSGYYVFAIK